MDKEMAQRFKEFSIISLASYIDAALLQQKNDPDGDQYSEGNRPSFTDAEIQGLYQELADTQKADPIALFSKEVDRVQSGRYRISGSKNLTVDEIEKKLVDMIEKEAKEDLVYLRTQKLIDAIMKRGYEYGFGESVAKNLSAELDVVDKNGNIKEYFHLTDTQLESIAQQFKKKTGITKLTQRVAKKQDPSTDASEILENLGIELK